MTILDSALLFLAAAMAGALNSVAGGGSFITFPTLLFLGVPPIQANATSTVALWPASIAGATALRRELDALRRYIVPLSIASLVGGLLGARLLLATSQALFSDLVPWLLLVATLVFAFGGELVARLRRRPHEVGGPPTRGALVAASVVQFVISVYGGYFGGGMGIMMLAAFTILGMGDIHAMNGMKNWLATFINGLAVVTFVIAGAVFWPQAGVMLVGGILGGYGGGSVSRRLNPLYVRRFVVTLGFLLSLYFFFGE